MGKKITLIAIIVFLLAGAGFYGIKSASPKQTPIATQPVITVSSQQVTSYSYKGQVGKDALTLLKAQTSVSQDHSGLVDTIGGRKADTSKHEYWAFYVNGKLATVGPAQYVTKNGDKIEWKIEKY